MSHHNALQLVQGILFRNADFKTTNKIFDVLVYSLIVILFDNLIYFFF